MFEVVFCGENIVILAIILIIGGTSMLTIVNRRRIYESFERKYKDNYRQFGYPVMGRMFGKEYAEPLGASLYAYMFRIGFSIIGALLILGGLTKITVTLFV